MYPIIDFRNGRYQGQTKNHLPDGVGILMDKNFLFCVGEWVAGQVKGALVCFYPSGRVFCGQIAFRQPQQLCTYELVEDHVKLMTFAKPRKSGEIQKIAGVMPLLKIILEIDNTNPKEARVLREHQYSVRNEGDNIRCINQILNLDRNGPEALARNSHCLQFLQQYFAYKYEEVFEFMINENKGRKQYFFGLRGQGLGIKIEPIEEPGLNYKKTGKVYLIRAVGYFTKQNQMKDIGLKTIDNAMKGVIVEQGVYSIPNTVIKYQTGKRPINCIMTFYNYIKRSLYYRDKVFETDYIYQMEKFVLGFNQNLRKAETERLAQYTIQNPNNTGPNLIEIQQKRLMKEKEKEQYLRRKDQVLDTPNPYNPNIAKYSNPEYNLQRAKDDILRSASKRRNGNNQIGQIDYNNVEYVDPNYVKLDREERPPRNYQIYNEGRPKYESGGPSRFIPREYQKDYSPNNPREYNRDYPREYGKEYPRDKSRDQVNSYLRGPRVDNSTFQNRFTSKRNYELIDPKQVSGRRNSPEKKYYYLDDGRPRNGDIYSTPPKRNYAYNQPYSNNLEQTRPKPRYDYQFQDRRERDYADEVPFRRGASPQRSNLRRRVYDQNDYE